MRSISSWERELDEWIAPFLEVFRHQAQRRWAPVYLRGLLGPGDRKSVQPMASRVAPADHEQLHHFVCTSSWDPAPLEAVLLQRAQQMLGGPGAVLVVDDTTLLKQGRHSVGVARQYSGAAGKRANCQCIVSLTLASHEVPLPIALRLFLPEEWTADPDRCRRAGVPEDRIRYRTKGEIALEEIDRALAVGVQFGCVLADAGYGNGAGFRHALSERGLLWAVGIPRIQKVYPATVELRQPVRPRTGRPPKHPVPTEERISAENLLGSLPAAAWKRVTWRRGTQGPLRERFAAVRVRVADGALFRGTQHLPGEEVWLIGERRHTGGRKYYLSNLPAETPLKTLAALIKARWSCEQAHQQLKEELGLDHFEGRSWSGLHHHLLLTQIAFTFLQALRLYEAAGRGKNRRRSTATAEPAGDPRPAVDVPGAVAAPALSSM
jgi:SRSO17 transposase